MERTDDNDEVFVVEGFPSPEAARETKKIKEEGSRSTATAWEEMGETAEESAMSSRLRQLARKIEIMADDLSYNAKKNVNTKVEIKKLARQLDLLTQDLSRTVGRKLRKSSGKKKGSGAASTQTSGASTQDVACQTSPPLLKQQRREEEKRKVTEAETEEDIVTSAKANWQKEWFRITTVRVGNAWNPLGEEDFTILLSANEASMESGIAKLLKDRFHEIMKIEWTGSLRVTNMTQVRAEDPTTRCRSIHKVCLDGNIELELLAALKTLAAEGSGAITIPIPNGGG